MRPRTSRWAVARAWETPNGVRFGSRTERPPGVQSGSACRTRKISACGCGRRRASRSLIARARAPAFARLRLAARFACVSGVTRAGGDRSDARGGRECAPEVAMTATVESRDGSGPSGFLARPLGLAGGLVLEAYFVSLGTVTAFVLWRIWPTGDGMGPVVLLGDRVAVSTDPDARLILIAALSALLGSFVHSATSLATYLGNHNLLP